MSTPHAAAPSPRRFAPWDSANPRALPAEALVLAAVIAVAIVIRILTIDNQSIWTDEALTTYETHLPFGAMLNTVAHYETTPPLYFVLIWCWAKLFGSGAIALRTFSEIGGVALVPITFAIGRELASRWVGVLAAAFVAINPLMVWYSQEARSYMLLAVLSAWAFLWFVRAHREASRRNVIWWTALSALALTSHFFAGFIVAPEAAWLLWRWRSRTLLSAVGAVVLVQLAMLPFAVIDTSHGTGWIHGIPRQTRIGQLALEWSVGTIYRRATTLEGVLGGFAFVAVVAALYRFGGDGLRRRRLLPAILIAGFVLVAPLLLGLLGPDFFLSRNAIPAFVPLAVVVAAACLMPRARLFGIALAAALLGLFAVATARVQTHNYLQRPDWRGLARSLGHAYVPRAIVAADGTTADPLKLYLPGVKWVENQSTPTRIDELDVIGLRGRRLALIPHHRPGEAVQIGPKRAVGIPYPATKAPPGSQLLERYRVDNWIVSRFVFNHPLRINITHLIGRLPSFFLHTPRVVLVFVQRPR